MRIEELAAAAGMTVRNIRNHQSRGLLHGPTVRGRVGFYDDSHVDRLTLIRRLQEDGLALKAIETLLMPEHADSRQLETFREAITTPVAEDAAPASIRRSDLTDEFGDVPQELIDRVIAHGVLRETGPDTFDLLEPALLRAAQESVRDGISLERSIELSERAAEAAEQAASVYVGAAVTAIWQPFLDAGQPEDQLADITDAILRLQVVGFDAFAALFKRAMLREIQTVLSRTGHGAETA